MRRKLTVITTTYNRAYCLHQVYESLLRQKTELLSWMIIDDGSTDDTKTLVDSWISENKLSIEYYYKKNGGMHTARNLAYELVETELNVIIDSDDWVVDGAIEQIVDFWGENKSDCYAGIIAKNITQDGKNISTALPQGVKSSTMTDMNSRHKVRGDVKRIFRSELTKRYPYPEFENEKFYPASYKFRMIDLDYEMLIMDTDVCVVDYNENSMTYDKFAQYKSCCNGFAHYRNEMVKILKSPKYIIRHMIHYIAECNFAKKSKIICCSAKPFYALLCYVPGYLYYLYLLNTRKKY